MPQVPFLWNGMEHDPADIQRFNGKPIAYIPTQTATGDLQLHIMDDVKPVRSWLETSLNWPWTDWNDQISFIGSSQSHCVFFDHINAQGDALLAGAFNGSNWIMDLTPIGWNDRISSFANTG